MPRGEQRRVLTPGYNQRRNTFITLFWPKRNSFIFNTYPKRRRREYEHDLSNLIQHALERVVEGLGGFREKVRKIVSRSKRANFDETGMPVGVKRGWIWVAAIRRFTCVAVAMIRGRKVLEIHFPGFSGVVTVDGRKPYGLFKTIQRGAGRTCSGRPTRSSPPWGHLPRDEGRAEEASAAQQELPLWDAPEAQGPPLERLHGRGRAEVRLEAQGGFDGPLHVHSLPGGADKQPRQEVAQGADNPSEDKRTRPRARMG